MEQVPIIWQPSVETNIEKVSRPGEQDQNRTFTTTCLRASHQTELLNRQILNATQLYNSTAQPFSRPRRSLSQGEVDLSSLKLQRETPMAPKLVHQQYNSPMNLYSMNNIKETIEAHSEMIAPGVKGINFLKSNKPIARQSEVYKLIMEEENRSVAQQGQSSAIHGKQVNQISGPSSRGELRQAAPIECAIDRRPVSECKSSHSAQVRRVFSTETQSVDAHHNAHYQQSGPAKLKCCECGQPIVGPFAKLQDRFIHPQCFNCTTCGTSLKNSGYFMINEKLYCEIHANHVANVMRLNQNFEPNKLSRQPAPDSATPTVPEPRDVSMLRSRSTSSIFNRTSSSAINEQQVAHSFTSDPKIIDKDRHGGQQCQCQVSNNSQGEATISTMFSNRYPPNHCCSCSCHGVKREIVWTWKPASQQQLGCSATSSHQGHSKFMQSTMASSNDHGAGKSASAPKQHIVHRHEQHGMSAAQTPVCHRCKIAIRGPYVLAGQTTWCKPCSQVNFVCQSCQRSLLSCGFIEKDSINDKRQYYCEFCYEDYMAPKCFKCSSKIKGDCLNALGKQWHPNCFVCGHCKQPFGNQSFYLENNVPYCQSDWNLLFTTKCSNCSYPIQVGDKWVEALNKNYHSDCFRCHTCQLKLEGATFYCKEGKPYCSMHAK